MMFRRRLTLLGCAFALCAAGLPAHARGERGGFFGGFAGFGGGHAMQAAGPNRGGGQGSARGSGGEERSRRAAAMENRRAENADSRPSPQRKLSPEERKQLRQNIYDVTRDIYTVAVSRAPGGPCIGTASGPCARGRSGGRICEFSAGRRFRWRWRWPAS